VIWRRHTRDEPAHRRAEDASRVDARLAEWLGAETADDDEAAEAALGALFAALPPVDPPPGLAQRVLAETVWAVDPTAAEMARGWWRAAAVLAGLALATALAGGALAPGVVALLDPAGAVSGALDGIVALLAAAGGWVATAARLADVLPWLGTTALRVASSPEVAGGLIVGAALVALAIGVLHQVLERDRRHSYAEVR
jgi:hypothetical protein